MKRVSIGLATLVLGLVAAFGYAQAPVPLINLPLVPDATAPGGPQFTLTINGTGFVSNSTVNWNGSALATTFVSGSKLTAIVPASDIAAASTGWVTVANPAPGGGTSNTVFFTVTTNVGNSLGFGLASSPATGADPWQVAVGDFNGDGKLDLAVVNACGFGTNSNCDPSGTVSILLGDGAGNFTLASSPAAGSFPVGVAVGDFNGDGNLDLAVTSYWGTVSILLGDGTGNFTLASSTAVGSNPYSVAVGDFNGDGKLDLAVANAGDDTASILLGDGTGNFTLASSPAVGWYPYSIAVGDFNGDGKLDLAVADYCGSEADPNCNSPGTVSILLGDGTGNFTLGSSYATGDTTDSVATGDFNGDGNLDLAVTSFGGAASIFLGDGTGHFTLVSSPAGGQDGCNVVVGDFNGDGILDVAVLNCLSNASHTISVLLGDGTGNFTLSSTVETDQANSIAAGDFNGDGRMDLAALNLGISFGWQTSTVSVLLQAAPNPAVTLSPSSLSFGTQLLGTTSTSQTVTLTNTGTGTLDITSLTASANFAQTNTCGSSLLVDASCTITVFFQPRSVGTLTGTVTITDNASNSPQTVALTGVGTEVRLSPTSLNFNTQTVGTASAPQTITLTNSGPRALTIAGIHVVGADSGDFAQTNTCGTSVPAESSCNISVTFTPQAKGVRQAVIGVSDNGGGAPQTVGLRGYGK